MLGFVLDVVFTVAAIRAILSLLKGVKIGMSVGTAEPQRRASGPPPQGVQMARDPVCGTYVVPDHAISISTGRERVYFCSAACRDKYQAKTA